MEGCDKEVVLVSDRLSLIVKDLRLHVYCKFRKDGCEQGCAEEDIIAEHETECGYRKVTCFQDSCPKQRVLDFEAHIFSAHREVYGKCKESPGKWFLIDFAGINIKGAQKMWRDLRFGHRFRAILFHNDEEKQWMCLAMVFGGKQIAKKFGVVLKLASDDSNISHLFNSNFYCLDDWGKVEASKVIHIDDELFKTYNKGHIELGDHNTDPNDGELRLPVSIEVAKKS